MADSDKKGGNVTNHGKRVMYREFCGDPTAQEAIGQELPYVAPGPTVRTNRIELWKCSNEQACQRTTIHADWVQGTSGIRNYGDRLVIHNESKIGKPFGNYLSWYASQNEKDGAPPFGVGTVGHQVHAFAVAAEKSPDVMVEGHWVVREGDATWQDAHNGKGVFRFGYDPGIGPNDADLVFAQCGVAKAHHDLQPRPDDDEQRVPRLPRRRSHAPGRAQERSGEASKDPTQASDAKCDFAYYKSKHSSAPETKHAAFTLSRNEAKPVSKVHNGWAAKKPETFDPKDAKVLFTDPDVNAKVYVSTYEIGIDWLLDPNEKAEEQKPTEAPQLGKSPTVDQGLIKSADQAKHDTTMASYQANKDAAQADYNARGGTADDQQHAQDARYVANVASAKKSVATGASKGVHAADNATQNYNKAAGSVNESLKAGARVFDSYVELKNFFFFQPLIIDITAFGCSSPFKGTVKAFPKGPCDLDIWQLKDLPFKKTIEPLVALLSKTSKWFASIEGANSKAHGDIGDLHFTAKAGPVTFDVDISIFRHLTGADDDAEPKVQLTAEWKELEHGSQDGKRKQWQVQRAWSLDVQFGHLLAFHCDAQVSIKAIPAVRVFLTILEFLGFNADAYLKFDFDISLGVQGKCTVDEYGEWKERALAFSVHGGAALSLHVDAGDLGTFSAALGGVWNPIFDVIMEDDQVLLKGRPSTVTFTATVKFTIAPNGFTRWSGIDGDHDYTIYTLDCPVSASELKVWSNST